MPGTDSFAPIAEEISLATGWPFTPRRVESMSGGCINESVCLSDGVRSFFVKRNHADLAPMFEAEAEGLAAIRETGAVRVPEPVCTGVSGPRSWLVLEYLSLGRAGPESERRLGAGLATMHRRTATAFGWHRDNTIGSTPQINERCPGWPAFWSRHRLSYQLELAQANGWNGALRARGERLLHHLPALLDGHEPAASLVHGDLWCGNVAYADDGSPILFDPAVYFGDRETDLAMTELFGGFGGDFYAAYNDVWPLPEGYALRRDLYNLYHVLNHLNLFGGGYFAQAKGLADRLLAEIG
jgi:fructosamine-3-kinase